MISIEEIKKLRGETGAGIADCREALSEADGDMTKAKEILQKKGLDKASSKSDREVKAGVVETYSHSGRIGVIVEVLCETDFVAKTEDFKTLAHEVAMQIASMNPRDTSELMEQEYIRDSSQKISGLVKTAVSKLGENIQIGKFSRIALGE
ncbi:translation elongation factor Ts [Candidatus Daviesbacteria bacterium RIFCSPHIGHO2_01_FULL_44_29]|uniref:Elongation factor Ts n=1 Tax=Candidatus Daviesbacteria bacterium RIFCSPHIGHO2_02_FULL_43_12 TaxID=1797776 RepID=A0A1F5KI52_9BACT|nr:MAG: translation elongation factor Ts [Candidatus Daviesbacteria bacterium RIFCSPHIGHO2_01_FULL_44_29]OGE39477.1 MAG: translation elongation factor Ts [Candidatus Daviesbacteria bacterium RIFCSPHIGHO2_12_FULL_47_45]OGE40637.1 MAG: translation elongation factor Ts [Candidatus Daviesbacteria bacterium RIFCSPHIGHO2_02_FULL_43_12]OGE69866.1 MAG: translation elongation factor Ts [Candidatus Daviesbacteria bacterium RIFCSPLOWO2_01_FULL_43_15]